jgi:TRAP-type C4-dicarboxylate transport system substrate-binding protein
MQSSQLSQKHQNRLLRMLLVLGLIASASLVFPMIAVASTIRINLGTLAPHGTHYHHSMLKMGEKWREASEGLIRLVVYPGGTQGGEADMVRLMQIGTLNAAMLSVTGLSDIVPEVTGLQNMPLAFRSLDEVDYVNDKLGPKLGKLFEQKGFVVLFWGNGGWVRYFSKESMFTPKDLKKMKMFVWAGDPAHVDILRHAGYYPVPLEPADLITSIKTPMVDAAPLYPIWALSAQIYLTAKHMLELNWAPLVGAVVIKTDTWNRIPAPLREKLLKIAGEVGREINDNSRKELLEAVEAMKRRGLIVHAVSPELESEWRTEVEKFYPEIRGRIVPADIFDETLDLLNEYRSKNRIK